MRETNFIKQNKKKWEKFEQVLKSDQKDPDKLSELFIQVTDDLSYSRTFYPNRSVRIYLNNLAQQIFYSIYKNKKEKGNKFLMFWKEELPYIIYQSRKELLLSFIVFLVAVGIGILSSAKDPNFPRVILGDAYVEMTIKNIENNDPMAVYKDSDQGSMFLQITTNNLRVSFGTFVFGAFFAIGTILVMLYNGIMIGAFQFFFYQKGLFLTSFLTIWMHGTLEISSIIIAGCAGLVMGKGLVFPGTYSRLQSFQISAQKGLKIMLGIVPIVIFAGIIESFITRYTDVPNILRATTILISLTFILGYFVYYPWVKSKNGFKFKFQDTKLSPKEKTEIRYSSIKSTAEIFGDSFLLFLKYFNKIFLPAIIATLIYVPLIFYFSYDNLSDQLTEIVMLFFRKLWIYFDYEQYSYMFFGNTLILSLIAAWTFTHLVNDSISQEKPIKVTPIILVQNFLKALPVISLINYTFFLDGTFVFLMLAFFMPALLVYLFVMIEEDVWFFKGIVRFFTITSGNYFRMLGMYYILATICVMYFCFANSPFLYLYMEVIQMNAAFDPKVMDKIFVVFVTTSTILGTCLIFPLILFGIGLLYFSLREINEAVGLKARIAKLSEKKTKRGYERKA